MVGHQKIIKFLSLSLEQNKLSHAYLFYGPKNIGKTTMAVKFIVDLLSRNLEVKQKSIIENQILRRVHPDVFWVEKDENKKNIVIEQIRDLQDKLSRHSLTGNYKVAIIEQGDKMSLEAFNSFLKILEEPPQKSIIILLVENLKLVPPTIISRCQVLKFNLVSRKEIYDYLVNQLKIKKDEAEIISRFSFGRPGLAWRYATNFELMAEYKREIKDFVKILNSPLYQKINFVNQKFAQPPFFVWQTLIRDLLLTKFGLPVVNAFIEKQIKILADQWTTDKLCQILTNLELTRRLFYLNVNKKLALENFLINL